MKYFIYSLTITFFLIKLDFLKCQNDLIKYKNCRLVRIKPKNNKENEVLLELNRQYKIELWNDPRKDCPPVLAKFDPDQKQHLQFLKEKGVEYELVSSNLQDIIERYWEEIRGSRNVSDNFDYIQKYHTYEEIVSELQRLSRDSKITKMVQNASAKQKNTIVIECGIHAREWIAPALCLYIISELFTNPENSAKLEKYEFVILPVLNVDGYRYTWNGDRMWRKTRSISNKIPHCEGADANRNFANHFCEVGSSTDPCDELYCGDYAFSEPETRAWRDFLLPLKDRIVLYLGVHNFAQMWLFPYGFTSAKPEDNDRMEELAKIGVEALQAVHGTKYQYGNIGNIINPASGSSIDWTYETLGVKSVFVLELRDKGQYGFLLPPSLIKPICEETWTGIRAVIDHL